MSRARILADYVSSGDELALKAPLASPAFTGTPTGITAAHLEAGVLPSDVTGGSGLTALGTVTSGNLSNTAIVYPAGHVIQVESFCLTATQSISISGSSTSGVTNLQKAITPRTSNSKMWITANISWSSTGNWGYFNINSSLDGEIGIGDAVGVRRRKASGAFYNSGDINSNVSCSFLDTPSNHGSAITYSIKIGNGGGSTHTHYLNTNQSGDLNTRATFSSTITIMEIAQ